MSDFQIALIGVGVVVVLGVALFNWWQERKLRRVTQAFESEHDDILLRLDEDKMSQRVEPELKTWFPEAGKTEPARAAETETPEPTGAAAESSDLLGEEAAVTESARVPEVQAVVDEIEKPAAVEPASSAASGPLPAARPRQAVAAAATPVTKDPPQELVDPEIHYLARLGFARPVRALALGDLMHHAATLGKPLLWAGLEAARQEWEEVTPFRNHDYVELVAGIQLADRNGALSEDGLERFCHQLQAFAVKHGGRVACPDQMSALDRAGALDIFCVDVDVLIGLNVIAQGSAPFPALQVGKLAEDAGMELSDEGVFHFRDERGESLFSLCNHDSAPFSKGKLDGMSTRGVTLLLDVPRVGDGIHVFDRMVALGRKLANEFGGLLVDDNNRPLSEAGIAKIRHQLTGIYAKMEERGVPPGGARALRLFR